MAPGGMANATSATIENRRTRQSIDGQLADAGFDPVAIGARAGDTVLVTFTLPGNVTERRWSVVPDRRRPVVLRSDAIGRDVPLNASLLIVFSEPIDPASLSGSIALTLDGSSVPGTVDVLPQQPWIVRFTPTNQLVDAAAYDLAVAGNVRDLDGDALESPATVTFTTVIASPSAGGRIAFSSWGPEGMIIYTMNPNGTGLVKVARGMDPSFSPDGKKLAFWQYSHVGGVVYTANADGSNITQLADGEQPTWSPDGQRLAYGCGGICIINADGTGLTAVTPPAPTSATGEACVRDTDPSWSPNGTTIAFTRWPDERIPASMCVSLGVAISFPFDFWTSVYLVDVDGSNVRPLRDAAGAIVTYAGWPSWSPDGKHLAFYFGNGSEERIDVVDADGSGIITVARRSPVSWDMVLGSPAWSPDGRHILVSSAGGWGFADASGSQSIERVRSPISIVPNSLTWSWSQR
jgi:TolB protein